MADDETPETKAEETEAATTPAEAEAVEAPESSAAAESEEAPAEEAAPKLSANDQAVLDAQKERSSRPSRTAEERNAERLKLRGEKAKARTRRRGQEKAKKAALPNGEGTPPAPPKESNPQVRLGTVVSAKPDKTIIVAIDHARRHRKYEKIVRSTSKLHAHDETNDAGEGDRVRLIECRPLSATKRWKLVEVLERAK